MLQITLIENGMNFQLASVEWENLGFVGILAFRYRISVVQEVLHYSIGGGAMDVFTHFELQKTLAFWFPHSASNCVCLYQYYLECAHLHARLYSRFYSVLSQARQSLHPALKFDRLGSYRWDDGFYGRVCCGILGFGRPTRPAPW